MKRTIAFVHALGLSLALAALPAPARAAVGIVAAVADGDTLEIDLEGRTLRVDLAGVDCPEKYQDFGADARRATLERTLLERVDVEVVGETEAGRPLVRVTLEDGSDLASELLELGLARYVRSTSGDPELGRLEREAREARRGLWGDSPAQAPRRERIRPPDRDTSPPPNTASASAPAPAETTARNCIPSSRCCKVCRKGKACGSSCISRSYTCRKGRGCACNASEVC